MIRIYKHLTEPASLAAHQSYNGEDVVRQLRTDQHGKCYLCERFTVTDFQVEHHKSQAKHTDLTCCWNNLFLSCSYCNGKKSDSFDNMVNPTENNIEENIEQRLDFNNSRAVFKYVGEEAINEEYKETISFLNRVFNGTNKLRTVREQQFYNYVLRGINSFQKLVVDWLLAPTKELDGAIRQSLGINKELLGFKYWIIKSNEQLLKAFGENIKWNKQ